MTDDRLIRPSAGDPYSCQLARFSDKPCRGRLIRAHLIPRNLLRRNGLAELIDDPRTYVVACGGPMGNSGHHGEFDALTLKVPRWAIPLGTEQLAHDVGLDWFLERRYGPR
jgi:hypothetical protein